MGKEASKGVLRRMLKGLAKYGLNISEEALGEGFQSAVSLANMDRVAKSEVAAKYESNPMGAGNIDSIFVNFM